MSHLEIWDPHTDIFYNAQSSQKNIMVSAHFYLQFPHCGTPYTNEDQMKEADSVKSFKILLKTHLFKQYFVT